MVFERQYAKSEYRLSQNDRTVQKFGYMSDAHLPVLTKQVDALSMRGESGLYDKLFWDRNYPNFDTENLTERTNNFNEIIR